MRRERHVSGIMGAIHLSHTAGLLVTSFGVGIGLVTAVIVLNFVSDAMRRVKERRNRLPALSEHDLMRLAQRSVRPQPVAHDPQMPMVVPRREG